jgi:hypothetical protein
VTGSRLNDPEMLHVLLRVDIAYKQLLFSVILKKKKKKEKQINW